MQLFERLCSNMEMQPPEFVVWTKIATGFVAAHVLFPEVRMFHVYLLTGYTTQLHFVAPPPPSLS
jgi:hypothetical protein